MQVKGMEHTAVRLDYSGLVVVSWPRLTIWRLFSEGVTLVHQIELSLYVLLAHTQN